VKKDVALITLVVRVPEVLAVHTSLPVSSLAELIAYAKANPGKVNFGSAGGGSITHLAGELLKAEAKIDLVHVALQGRRAGGERFCSAARCRWASSTCRCCSATSAAAS